MSVAAGQTAPPEPSNEAAVEMPTVVVVERIMLTLHRALDDWLDDLERRDYSAGTIREYGRYVGLLCDSLPRDTDVSKITLDQHIYPFLRRYRTRSKSTKATAETAICSCFTWLHKQGKLTRNPTENLVRTLRPASEDLNVVTVSADDVRRMLLHADAFGWPERLAMHILAYLGPRKHAVSELRITDYDRARGQIRFREKGGKTIYKPIPDELDALIEQAIAAGVYDDQDYLVPSVRPAQVKGPGRSDQFIYQIVKRVAKKAGVVSHVHALRAAFACFYLEQNPNDISGLKELLGHRHLATTEIYLRKQNKQKAMEPVRALSWAVASPDAASAEDGRNLRESLLRSAVDAAALTTNVRKASGRMDTGLAPNGTDEGS